MRNTALFINGIHESVLEEILHFQEEVPNGQSYLQPHKSVAIQMLSTEPPSDALPVRLYASTTANLNLICFTGEIIRWEDKRSMAEGRHRQVSQHLAQHQPGEVELFLGSQKAGKDSVNLLTIRNLKRVENPPSRLGLKKISDNRPLMERTRSGGWSEVYDIGDLNLSSTESYPAYVAQLESDVKAALDLPDSELDRLAMMAPPHPERFQVISLEFKRSPYIIAATLRRAAGTCEGCGERAPFNRRSDGSPYLEVHHHTPLSEGGSDTIVNTIALCPNCHRKCHHG